MKAVVALLDSQRKEQKVLEDQLGRVRKRLEAKGDEIEATKAKIVELRAPAVEYPSSPCSPPFVLAPSHGVPGNPRDPVVIWEYLGNGGWKPMGEVDSAFVDSYFRAGYPFFSRPISFDSRYEWDLNECIQVRQWYDGEELQDVRRRPIRRIVVLNQGTDSRVVPDEGGSRCPDC